MRRWTLAAAVAAVTVACTAVSGCTLNFGNPTGSGTVKLSKADLQKDISQRLADAGRAPQSVSCPDDLVGEVGKTMRCGVIISATSSLEPIVTVTGVEGDKVDYDIAPAVSKTQLEKSVSLQVATSSRAPVNSVSCESGLEGKVGAAAYCEVTSGGVTLRRTVEVTSVSGLWMNYALVPMLPKDVVAKSLLAQLAQTGQHPDSATCTDNLEGKLGNTVECTTVSGAQTQTYVLTVTAVQGGSITFQFVPKP